LYILIYIISSSRNYSLLQDTLWWNGQLVRRPLPVNQPVLATIADAIAGTRDGNPRLYLTDGSMPDYEAQNYPRAAPGMPCQVDALSNGMLPHAVRSSRSTNLFHFLKNESTGTGTFTLFNGVGPGANLTAFHFETKRRRSYNCATGDYIIQPLAASANTRAMMRVHAAVTGRHSRHGQLLPLECYLEEGITMITHLRTDSDPSLCELCEQSMHAFITFEDGTTTDDSDTNTAAGSILPTAAPAGNEGGSGGGGGISNLLFPSKDTPNHGGINNGSDANNVTTTTTTNNYSTTMPLKVSCNDFDLIWDIDATYYMERVSNAYQSVGIMPEEAPPPDGADTWVQSSYLTAEPRTLKGNHGSTGHRDNPGDANNASIDTNNVITDPSLSAALAANKNGPITKTLLRPWACEVTSAARKEINSPGWKADLRGQKKDFIGDFDLDSGMDVIVVRTAEKLLDVILMKVTREVVQPWVGEVPSIIEAKDGLKRLIPVVNDMLTRAYSENDSNSYVEEFFNRNHHNQQHQETHFNSPNGAAEKSAAGCGDDDLEAGGTISEKLAADPCHFSREYLEDLLQKISCTGLQGAVASTATTMFSSVVAHVPPNMFLSENAEEIGQHLPAKLLRDFWMHRLVEERKAILAQPLNLEAMAAARRRRHAVELAFDTASCDIITRNAPAWRMSSPVENASNEELQHVEID
jgi:hypothetical protein